MGKFFCFIYSDGEDLLLRDTRQECQDGRNLVECFCRRTCLNRDMVVCDTNCDRPGCECPGGMVEHEDKCIDPMECPCVYLGTFYDEGDTVHMDCKEW